MEKKETFIQKHYIIAALLLTIGGFFSLRLGGRVVESMPEDIASITSYIVPFIFLILVKVLFKLKNNESLTPVYDKNNPKTIKRFVLIVLIGLLALSVPIFLTIIGDLSTLAGKPLAKNAGTILFYLILLNLCIGLFEEGLFRNLMMKIMLVDNKKSTYIKAFFVTAILFGLIHLGNLSFAFTRPIAISSQVIYATFMGMLMAGLYFKYRNFYALVFLHGLFDFISMIPKLYGVNADIANNAIPDLTLAQGFNTIITTLPAAIVGLLLLRSFLKKNLSA